jgi:hypothetical protein
MESQGAGIGRTVGPRAAKLEPTEQDIEELLQDPACPRGRGLKE